MNDKIKKFFLKQPSKKSKVFFQKQQREKTKVFFQKQPRGELKVFLKNSESAKFKIKFVLMVMFLLVLLIICNLLVKTNFTYATSRYGSRGDEVIKIQTKLKNWGYYSGSVDGIYGSATVTAVKKFQSKNGLTVDGIAGTSTLKEMGIFTSSSSSTSTSSNSSNVNLLSRLIYAEARGEPYNGQVAVGAVILNRVKSSKFPNTISGVIYQAGAFDGVSDGQINLTPNATAKKAAQDAINGWDPSYGAIYYFNPATATNKWIWSRPMTIVIGHHRFCK